MRLLFNILFLLGFTSGVSGIMNPSTYMRTDYTILSTPDWTHYQRNSYDFQDDRQYFIFQVKACHDAHIYMSDHWHQFLNGTEIIIGGWKNTKSAVVSMPTRQDSVFLQTVDTPDIIDCIDFRSFWISWANNKILVGKGEIVGRQTFLNVDRSVNRPELAHPVHTLKLSSGFGAVGSYQVKENRAELLWIQTSKEYGYRFAWKTARYKAQFFTFEVMGCSEVYVSLAQTAGINNHDAYEIVLGSSYGRFVLIRRQHQWHTLANRTHDNILGCSYYKPFWISWDEGKIRVGRGNFYGQQVLAEATDPNPRHITALGFSTGYQNSGHWRFDEDLEPTYFIRSPLGSQSVNWISVVRQNFVRFLVQPTASSEIRILLSPDKDDSQTGSGEAVELVIAQPSDNQLISFQRKQDGSILSQASANYITRDGLMKKFWLSWANGRIAFGDNLMIGYETKLQVDAPANFVVNSVSFTSSGDGTIWRIRHNIGELMTIRSLGRSMMAQQDVWVTTHQEYYKVFRIKGCTPADILMTSRTMGISANTYLVRIGANSNQNTLIAEGLFINPDKAIASPYASTSAPTPNILSCTEFRTFWVGWLNGTISVGQGWRLGQNLIITKPETKQHPVEAVSISSMDSQQSIDWRFESDKGDRMMLNTTGSSNDNHWFLLKSDRTWIAFSVISCSNIKVMLAESFSGNSQGSAYTIVIGDNNQGYIMKGGTKYDSKDTTGYLDCIYPRDFWISWKSGNIQFGQGRDPSFGMVSQWQDPQPVNVKALGTSTEGQSAEWSLSVEDYTESSHSILPDGRYSHAWTSTKHRQELIIGVQTCTDFRMILSPIIGYTHPAYTYSVNLGVNGGKECNIRSGDNGEVMIAAQTTSPFKCGEEVFIWLSYYNGVIMSGTGNVSGKNVLINLPSAANTDVKAISFRSGDGNPIQVRMTHNADTFSSSRPQAGSSGLSKGAIAGIIVAVLLVIGLLSLAIFYVRFSSGRVPAFLEKFRNKNPGNPNFSNFANPNVS